MKPRNPFIYIEKFLSPLACENYNEKLELYQPDVNEQGVPIPLILEDEEIYEHVIDSLHNIINEICSYYGTEYKGIDSMQIEWLPAGSALPVHSENSELISNKWVKTQNRDLTGVVFFNSHIDSAQINEMDDFDCSGGKLQFVNYQFGFMPQIGDMVIYPSDARFSNSTSPVHAGDLVQLRFHIVTKVPYFHDISKFPGTYKDWF